MCTVRSEQDTTERSAERQEPVPHPSAGRPGRASDEVGDDDPHLLEEENRTDEAMGLEVALQGGISEEGCARGADECRRDPDESIERRTAEYLVQPPDPEGEGRAVWGAELRSPTGGLGAVRNGSLVVEQARLFGQHGRSAHGWS